ncbi:MAG: penicillin-binding transpeptidase domain-containing protein, partial [Traorella sp.]
LSVTPLQLVRAFSAIINGGILYEPYIVSNISHPLTNEIIYEKKPNNQGNIISSETSALMRFALESVVANGGGKNAYMDGYKIGGKTGTAQKAVDGVYLSSEYILSFLSAAGMDDPQIVLYVSCDSPKNEIQYGGVVVAPVVKAMYEDILPYMKIKQVEKQIPKKTSWLDPNMIEVENYIGKNKEDCKQEGLQFEFIGEGNQVIEQYPQAKIKIEENSKVVIILA